MAKARQRWLLPFIERIKGFWKVETNLRQIENINSNIKKAMSMRQTAPNLDISKIWIRISLRQVS